jgi:ferrous iron transport protein B
LQVREAEVRYGYSGEVIAAVVTRPAEPRVTRTERIDAILTHKIWGTGLLVVVGYFVFMSIFTWATPVMDFVEATFAMLGKQVEALGFLGEGALKSLLVDGVITGVGGVVVFLPQILVLFAFIAILEDCGYMARAAFLMDRLLRWCGLSGRSFIPLLSSFACAVPGIMATRTIESRRDRLVTILVAPLMTCSARIPIYVILTAAFVPATMVLGFVNLQALVFASLYFLGIVVAVLVAWALRRTKFRGAATPFLMELPPYKMPSPNIVIQRMLRQATHFLSRAGTLILASSLVIWALAYWPRADFVQPAAPGTAAASEMTADQLQLQQSFLGRMGRVVEPAFAPMGWDWKVSIAVIASFPAREVVVSTLGVIYGLGEVDEESTALRERIREVTWDHGPRQGEKVLDLAGALALMVFFALCAQCAATLMTIGKETGSWGWPVFTFVYMTTLAYVGAIVTAVLARAILA